MHWETIPIAIIMVELYTYVVIVIEDHLNQLQDINRNQFKLAFKVR